MAITTEQLERLEMLERERVQIKIAFPWMLEDIKHRAEQIRPGDYSDELQHAMGCGEMLRVP